MSFEEGIVGQYFDAADAAVVGCHHEAEADGVARYDTYRVLGLKDTDEDVIRGFEHVVDGVA